jgi:hypothetical protein
VKEACRTSREQSETRKSLVAEAVDEVVAEQPIGRDEILQAIEEAYRRRGIELSNIERVSLVDVVEVRLASGPAKQALGLKAIGGVLFNTVREIARAVAEDRGNSAESD